MKRIFLLLTLLVSVSVTSVAQTGYATISGNMDFLKPSDSAKIDIDKYGMPNFIGYTKTYLGHITSHTFTFKIPVEQIPLLFSMSFSRGDSDLENIYNYFGLVANGYYLEDGDSIVLERTKDGSVKISGKGHQKFEVINHFMEIDAKFEHPVLSPSDMKLHFEKIDSAIIEKLDYLNSKSGVLSQNIFVLLKAKIIGGFYGRTSFLRLVNDSIRNNLIAGLKDYKCLLPAKVLGNAEFNNQSIIKYSDVYAGGILYKYVYDSCYVAKRPLNVKDCYDYIVSNFKGALRERLIVHFFYINRKKSFDISPYVNDAFNYTQDPDFINILLSLKNNRVKGALAYNFKLPDVNGVMHSLEEYKGKVVFIDFWFTGCHNCIAVTPYLAKIEETFLGKPVVFFSINLDKRKEQWVQSIKGGKYTSKYSVDLFTDGKAFQHPISKIYQVDGGPTLIMIDKDGKLMRNPIDPRFDKGKDIKDLINQEIGN